VETARVETSREAVRARLADLVASRDPEMSAHVLVSDGEPAEEILRIEELFGIDLIVIAPHGRPTLGKIIFGSVADKVTRGSRAHLLLVKSPPPDELPADPAVA
jgi:nucleotide-binding universal stress UspA family protein